MNSKIFRFSAVLIIALFFVGALSSCSSYKNVTAPTVDGISNFKVGKLNGGELPFSFTTRLKNPDKLKFKVKRVDLDLMLAGTRIAQIKSGRTMKIRRQLQPEMDWNVTAELAPMLKKPGALLGTLFTGRVNFEVSGSMTIRKWFWTRTIPVTLKLPVEIPFR
jgi:LEA14-like dessication related protein